jgi:hypothetical protein
VTTRGVDARSEVLYGPLAEWYANFRVANRREPRPSEIHAAGVRAERERVLAIMDTARHEVDNFSYSEETRAYVRRLRAAIAAPDAAAEDE